MLEGAVVNAALFLVGLPAAAYASGPALLIIAAIERAKRRLVVEIGLAFVILEVGMLGAGHVEDLDEAPIEGHQQPDTGVTRTP